MPRDGQLTQIADALHPVGPGFGAGKSGKQQGGKDRDDRNHHKQFDQREGPLRSARSSDFVLHQHLNWQQE